MSKRTLSIYNKDLDTLLKIGHEAHKRKKWQPYSQYCYLRSEGFRLQAFHRIGEFIQHASQWCLVDRTEFVRWIKSIERYNPELYGLIPHPLQEKFLQPTLEEWTRVEPENPEPLSLMDSLNSLERANELDPGNSAIRHRLILKYMEQIDYTLHELPYKFLGKPRTCLENIITVKRLLLAYPGQNRESLRLDIIEMHELLQSWQDYQKKGRHLGRPFHLWARLNNRPFRLATPD